MGQFLQQEGHNAAARFTLQWLQGLLWRVHEVPTGGCWWASGKTQEGHLQRRTLWKYCRMDCGEYSRAKAVVTPCCYHNINAHREPILYVSFRLTGGQCCWWASPSLCWWPASSRSAAYTLQAVIPNCPHQSHYQVPNILFLEIYSIQG